MAIAHLKLHAAPCIIPPAPVEPRLSTNSQSESFENDLTTVRVSLDETPYDILIGSNWIERFGQSIRRREKEPSPNAMVFTSPRIGKLHFAALASSLEKVGFTNIVRHDIPDGDENKNTDEWAKGVEAISSGFADSEIKPIVFNLGGGVVGDIGGFIAGTYWRGNGVRYVQVATTLLACVDCSVGGKVGVNVGNIKNQVGMFYQPFLVLIDLALLDTLDEAELRSGLAEVVKYGVVYDEDVFGLLERNAEAVLRRDKGILHSLVTKCCDIKAKIVVEDERDTSDKRIVLNFGHTIGHAIETASRFTIRHGEAVAIGMLGATRLAIEIGICDEQLYTRLLGIIRRIGLPEKVVGTRIRVDQVMEAMQHDKKFVRGKNCFVLPTQLGQSRVERGIDPDLIRSAVASCL